MTKAFAWVALAAVVGAAPALADSGGRHGGRLLERLDLNQDGAIDRLEARSFREARFERLDRDGDGAVTEAEMIAAAQERVAWRTSKMFARMDRNGDGRIEEAKLAERGQQRFEWTDTNADGRVTMEEIRARWLAWRHGDDSEVPPAD